MKIKIIFILSSLPTTSGGVFQNLQPKSQIAAERIIGGQVLYMQQNLGRLDRVLRFLLAFWWLGPIAPVYGPAWLNIVIAVVGWIALAESFLGWCWLHALLRIDNRKQ